MAQRRSLAMGFRRRLTASLTGGDRQLKDRSGRVKPLAWAEMLEERRLLSGAEYLVNSLADDVAADGVLTLREAIQASNTDAAVNEAPAGSGSETDVIRFDPALFADGAATIHLNGSELQISGALEIHGPGADQLTIDAGGSSRVFNVLQSAAATLDGVRITGGRAANGGGICNAGVLAISNAVITGNTATGSGGGVGSGSSLDASVTLLNVEISNNSAGNYGGGLNGENLTMTNVTFTNNEGIQGGAVAVLGVMMASGLRVYNNIAAQSGGGIFILFAEKLTITDSSVCSNVAGESGGGISIGYGTVTIANTTIADNTAGRGGGIHVDDSLLASFSLISSTIARNLGGGLRGSAMMTNTVVAGNTFGYLQRSDILDGSPRTGSDYNLIGIMDPGYAAIAGPHTLFGTVDAPLDAKLGDPTSVNGMVIVPLLPGSPAIDAGSDALAVNAQGEPLSSDQIGNPRIAGAAVDIGAVEGALNSPTGVTYLVQSLADDVSADGVLTLREAIEAASLNEAVGDAPAGSFSEADHIVFAAGLTGTIELRGGPLVLQGRLTIEGPGAELLTLRGDGASRVLAIMGSGDISLSGVTITGGAGGIFNGGKLVLADSTVSGNAVPADSVLPDGGGIFSQGELRLINDRITGNSTSHGGGGVASRGSVPFFVNGAIIMDNSAAGGGGISCGDATIFNTTIARNSAGSGGGIMSGGTVTLTQSTIAENTASRLGGGIYSPYGQVVLSGVTVARNSAGETHGGICANTSKLANSILAANQAPAFPDGSVYPYGESSYNVIGVAASSGPGGYLPSLHTYYGTDEAPLDPKLGPLTLINGMPVVPLLPGSPAVNAGSNDLAVDLAGDPLEADLAGQPRISVGVVDIGAFEFQGQLQDVVITGTSGDDTIAIGQDGGALSWTINDGPPVQVPWVFVTSLRIDASQGNDTLTFDLDLHLNSFIIDANPASRQSILDAVTRAIGSARNNNPIWSGSGIRLVRPPYTDTLGAILNRDAQGRIIHATFEGEDVDENSILVKRAVEGDADLSGKVDGSDYFFIDKAYLSRNLPNPPGGFGNGDFNYDGQIDGSDYFLIDKTFLSQKAPAAAAPMSASAGPSGGVKKLFYRHRAAKGLRVLR